MAVDPTVSRDLSNGDGSVVLASWSLTTANPTGTGLEWTEWADRTFQVAGTFGGATLTLEGSNDGTNWATLSNAAGGTAATFTTAGIKTVIELPRYVRPNLTTVGVGATLTATLVARRANPMRT